MTTKKISYAEGGFVAPAAKSETAGLVHAGAERVMQEAPKNMVTELADAFGLSSYNLVSFSLTVDGESAVVNGEYKVRDDDGKLTSRIKKLNLQRV